MSAAPVRRIAMWSGPRNLSTALMRSFAARGDCSVWDEPFYGAYLAETGLDHPMRAEILASCETDWRRVARACAEGGTRPVFYQKQMTHHILPAMTTDWLAEVTNAFLIRAPERVLASYAVKREAPELADIGFLQQADLFSRVADRLGHAPPVVAAEDIRAAPARVLPALCAALRLPWDASMLSWTPGPQPFDGVWAPHWYDSVWRSTGFGAAETESLPALPPDLARLADLARPAYERLLPHRIPG